MKLLHLMVKDEIHLQENKLFDIGVKTLTLGSMSHEILPSPLYIMWLIKQQSLKLLRLMVEVIHLQVT